MVCKKVFNGWPPLGVLFAGGLFLLLISGCASTPEFNRLASCNPEDQVLHLKLQNYFNDIADELCGECKKRPCGDRPMMVPEFVDIQTMEPRKTGVLMGELMRASISRVCRYRIVQEKFSHLFKVSDNGLISLRNQSPSDTGNSLLGTFSATPERLFIFSKVIRNSDGEIIKMTSKEVNISCD